MKSSITGKQKYKTEAKTVFPARNSVAFFSFPVAPRNILNSICKNHIEMTYCYFGILIAGRRWNIKMSCRYVKVKPSEISVPETSRFMTHKKKNPCNSLTTVLPIMFFKTDTSENSNLNHFMLHSDIAMSFSCHQPCR